MRATPFSRPITPTPPAAISLKWMDAPEKPFDRPEQWSDATFRARDKDVETLIAAASHDPRFTQYDWNAIGLAGHSLGGYTVLGLAGSWRSWKDPRVKAVLALSPYATPYIVNHTLANIAVPVMYQGGTRDSGHHALCRQRRRRLRSNPCAEILCRARRRGPFRMDRFEPALRQDDQRL